MAFQPTKDGGRRATGVTPWGRYYFEWDKDGKRIADKVEFLTPNDKSNCTHRSINPVELRECGSCKGVVKIKVFQCSGGHGLCSIGKPVGDDVQTCESCPDFKLKAMEL